LVEAAVYGLAAGLASVAFEVAINWVYGATIVRFSHGTPRDRRRQPQPRAARGWEDGPGCVARTWSDGRLHAPRGQSSASRRELDFTPRFGPSTLPLLQDSTPRSRNVFQNVEAGTFMGKILPLEEGCFKSPIPKALQYQLTVSAYRHKMHILFLH
jgi:hypothetical protein